MMEFFPFYAAVFIVIFVPIWIFLDWIIKKYTFSNRIFNAFLVFNAIFSSPLNVMVSAFLVAPKTVVPFLVTIAIFAVIKFFVWVKLNGSKVSYESVLGYSKRYFFQLPLLVPTYFLFITYDDFSLFILYTFLIYAIFAVAIYMYLSGKYAYKPIWFKNKTNS